MRTPEGTRKPTHQVTNPRYVPCNLAPLSSFHAVSHSIGFVSCSGRKAMMTCRRVRPIVAAVAILLGQAFFGQGWGARAADLNDYPTSARAEYVFGCMKANGEARQAIEQCSCSIDVVASLLPYDRYVEAETVLSMSQVRSTLAGQFRSSPQAASVLNDLRRAQAEAEVRCF